MRLAPMDSGSLPGHDECDRFFDQVVSHYDAENFGAELTGKNCCSAEQF